MLIAIVVLVVLIIAVAIAMATAYRFNNLTLHPKTFTYDRIFDEMQGKGNYYGYSSEQPVHEEVVVKSDFGYDLYGKWYPFENSKKSVIIAHGYTVNIMTSLRFLDLFYSKGYNVLLYDHRYHGRSGGESCSLGYFEQHDLRRCIDFVLKKVGEGATVGLHGESMGAVTSLLTASLDDRVSFVVADCGFADLKEELSYQISYGYKLPGPPLVFLADKLNIIRAKHSYSEVSPIKVINQVKAPILFIHGEKDSVTPAECSIKMHSTFKGKKELYITKDTEHAESMHVDKDKYYSVVYDFLDKFTSNLKSS